MRTIIINKCQALNRAWILLQDYEFTETPDDGSWILLTSTKLPDVAPKATRLLSDEPIQDTSLANSTLSEISKFIETNEAELGKMEITSDNWIVIDQEGLDSSTCILVNRQFDEETNEIGQEFKALRLPLTEAWPMFANLDIANMDFEDWIDEDTGVQEDGLYKWVGPFPTENEGITQGKSDVEAKREAALKAAKDLGKIE